MQRRYFLGLATTTLAASAVPCLAFAESLEFTPGILDERLAAGDIVFLNFKANWCSTCARQDRVLTELKDMNPDYATNITFIDVDWDRYKNSDLRSELRIPRRSTLVVLKGDQEIGRLIAETRERQIRALMDDALSAR